jgi:WD40 repeat protein
LRALAERGSGTVGLASTAALHGTGGFGKTTLALDVCHSPEILELFPDGVVWVEIGQEPVLTAVLADVAARVSRTPPVRYGTVDAASAALVDALGDHRVLVVLDNVWRAADLEPFLRGGPACVRLVTSRRIDVLPTGATVVQVDRMGPEQAVALLQQDLPAATDAVVYPLYERSHRWPVVLGMLNGVLRSRSARSSGQPLAELVADLAARLDRLGVTGADEIVDGEVRTARDVLGIGLAELAAGPGGPLLRERYLSLAAFPPDQLASFTTLAALWRCDGIETRTVCDRLADRSLLGSTERDGVRLHDVIRDHLIHDHHHDVQRWAGSLLEVLRSRCPHGAWHLAAGADADDLDALAFLLVFTDREAELRALLFDLRFLVRRIRQGGVGGVASDIAVCQSAAARDPHMSALARVVSLEGHLAGRVSDDPSVGATLFARLVGDPDLGVRVTHRDEALAAALVATHPLPDRPDPRLLQVLSGHTDRVLTVCWRPDGQRLAGGSADGVLRVWDERGQLLRSVEFDAAVNEVRWSPDRLHVAVLVGASSVCLVEPILGEVRGRLERDGEVTCLTWASDDAVVVVGHGDGSVAYWDGDAEPTVVRAASGSPVRALDWAQHGLITVQSDGTLTAHTGNIRRSSATGLNVPRAITARPGTAEVAIGAATQGVYMAEVAPSPRLVARSNPTVGWVTSADWSTDGAWLAAGLQDGAVALWSARREDEHEAPPDDELRRRWETTLTEQPHLDYHGVRVAALDWHPRRSRLAVAAHTDVRIFDVERAPDRTPHAGVNCLRWHPHRPVLVAGTMGGEILVVDGTRPATRRTLPAHSGQIRALAFSPDGRRIASIAEEGPLLLWDADTFAAPEPVRCPVRLAGALAWSPDGAVLAVGGQGEVALLDANSLRLRRTIEVADLVNGLDIDPSGRFMAVATSGSSIVIQCVESGAARRLDGHLSSVGSVCWADPTRLVSGGYDGQALVWSVPDSTVLAGLQPGGGAVWDVSVRNDRVLTATSTGMLGHHLITGAARCHVAFDTALSSCRHASTGGLIAAGGAAGVAMFHDGPRDC